ncbi:non-specific serine/threonine protein kinase [Malassezia caprae]|uniref:non-specific serine/threonine protein kinase n=1 Tax=Malassezia caprae TaxID=1381934 RepID=A0AAF0E6G6_9BASI|nr:non-specific serine/threonine protein kinase [Malassezia caprae]
MGWHTSESPASDEPPPPRRHALSRSTGETPALMSLQPGMRAFPALAADLPNARTRSGSRSSSQASDPFGSSDSLTYAGGREDRASTAGIFELDTDVATSGSENDEPSTPSQTVFQRRAPFSRTSSAMRSGLGYRTTSTTQPWRSSFDRTSEGSSAHSSPLAPPPRPFRTTPSFSSPLAMEPVLPHEDVPERISPPSHCAGPSRPPPRLGSALLQLPHSRVSTRRLTPPSTMGPPDAFSSSNTRSSHQALHRRAHSTCSVPVDPSVCGSPMGGPDGVDPHLVAAMRQGVGIPTRNWRSMSAALSSTPGTSMSPPSDSPMSFESPRGSPAPRRDMIRLQRMPRSAMAHDLVLPSASHTREAAPMSSPRPSPTSSDSMPNQPTLLGLSLAMPSDGPRSSSPREAGPWEAHVLHASREYKRRHYSHAALHAWDDAWIDAAAPRTRVALHACSHWDRVRHAVQAPSATDVTAQPPWLRHLRVTASDPDLATLRPLHTAPRLPDRERDVFGRRRQPPSSRAARIVSEKHTNATRRPSGSSMDDSAAVQRRHLWDELVQAKGLCDTELDKIIAGILSLSEEVLALRRSGDEQDPDATSVMVPLDGPMPLTPLERLAAQAVEIRTTSLHTLLEKTSLCSAAIASVQALGAVWDEHGEWPGRGWYVELLLTLAALSRVLEWWDAEYRFWGSDPRPASPPASRAQPSMLTPVLTEEPQVLEPPEPPAAPNDAKLSNILMELTLDLRMQFVSLSWQRVIGTDVDQLLDQPVDHILPPGGRALFERATRQLLDSPGHTVEVVMEVSVPGSESAHAPVLMVAKGMLVHHASASGASHTMWMLNPAPASALPTGDLRDAGAIGGVPEDLDAISTELLLCRICEREIPAWFFAQHSEICHEMHRLEMQLSTCNETLQDMLECAHNARDALVARSTPGPAFRGQLIEAPAELALRVVDQVVHGLEMALAIAMPSLPEEGELSQSRLLPAESERAMDRVRRWRRPSPSDAALQLLCADAMRAMQDKVHMVNRMRHTILYVETVRQESEQYVAELLDGQAAAPGTPPVVVESEDMLDGVQSLMLDPVDDPSDDDRWSATQSRSSIPIPIPGSAKAVGTPPQSPFLAPADAGGLSRSLARSLARSPRLGTTPHSPRLLPAAQPRATAASIRDFELLKPISKGAYGSVFLARKRATGDLFAIKMLKKSDMIAKNQITNVRAERMIMMNRTQSPFVVKLFFTFQSPEFLYLVMEYLPGGDCASLVKVFGALPPAWAQQYLAEMVQGLEYLHSTGVVHRDMKPDNLLIDHHGHLKLTDFGLSKFGLLGRHRQTAAAHGHAAHATWAQPGARASSPVPLASVSGRGLEMSHADVSPSDTESFLHSMTTETPGGRIVGTPDYLAPESILGVGMDDFGVDWWAVGVILFEFVHGYPPFHAETPTEVFDRILSRQIAWDADAELPPGAHDLIDRLLCMDRTQRLGAGGVEEITSHPYFDGIDWDHLVDHDGPFVPQLDDAASTDYFDARGAVPQLWHDDEPDVQAPSGGSDTSSPQAANEFGSFSYKNLPVLKQANDEMLRRVLTDIPAPASPAGSVSSPVLMRASSDVQLERGTSGDGRASSLSGRSETRTERCVLLSDPNPVSRLVLQAMVTGTGAHVVVAHDNVDLVQLAMGETKYDAVMIKLGDDVADAHNAARMIKSTRNVNCTTPIVALVMGEVALSMPESIFDAVQPLTAPTTAILHRLQSLYDAPPSRVAAVEACQMALAQLAM